MNCVLLMQLAMSVHIPRKCRSHEVRKGDGNICNFSHAYFPIFFSKGRKFAKKVCYEKKSEVIGHLRKSTAAEVSALSVNPAAAYISFLAGALADAVGERHSPVLPLRIFTARNLWRH